MFLMPLIFGTILSSIFVLVNFIFYLWKGHIKTKDSLFRSIEIYTVFILPLIFLAMFDFWSGNECCTDSAIFSPEHRIGIYMLILGSIIAFGFTIFRKNLFTPALELLLNVFLVLGLIINILLCIHLTTSNDGYIWWVFGNIPILLVFIIRLHKNHQLLQQYIVDNKITASSFFGKLSLSILNLKPLVKYPILVMLLVPILILLSVFLMLFGQKPDSIIRSFTDTYKHGFSQLDYMCDNVDCGGHYLCSVGANGHQIIVKPIRLGERNGGTIVCNRQLLISNAFEDLLQERMPKFHKFVRGKYNKVGDLVHKYYSVFSIKLVSDMIYLLMKPLEWLFLITLYVFDEKPENRISVQYLKKQDRIVIKNHIS